MDPSSFHLSPTELYELIGVVGGLGVTGTLGVLFVRRARASRRRQIEESGDGPPALGGAEERAAKPARSRDRAREPQPEPAPKKRANPLVPGLARTRSGFVARLGAVFTGRKQIDPAVVDEIEKVLLTADIGVKTSQKLLEEIRSSLSRSELKDPDAVWAFLRQRSTEMLSLPAPDVDFGSAKPFVLLVIGVNGSGKTTTIGKLAARLAGDGKKVLMAAGD
ncbi:MAG: signal recognition particle receptor subunit alpha, partial [Polyangia bacterium]